MRLLSVHISLAKEGVKAGYESDWILPGLAGLGSSILYDIAIFVGIILVAGVVGLGLGFAGLGSLGSSVGFLIGLAGGLAMVLTDPIAGAIVAAFVYKA
ncbi:MAG: hypothetical protein GY822_01800 [Deltaproteobacteria bacterium]|nr:hypothetical protein [Deltaproteobacteria bacterium]